MNYIVTCINTYIVTWINTNTNYYYYLFGQLRNGVLTGART